jgi:dynein light chain 4
MNASADNLAATSEKQEESTQRKNFNYALVKVCDMVEELRVEAVDMCVTAVERHPGNYEACVLELMR